jgi:hypothetical protein
MLWIYRGCLALYPAEFRDEYARELCLAFTHRWREERSPRVCWEALGGILQEAPKEHLHVILRDLRHALRILRKDTTVTLAALAILALGIGATHRYSISPMDYCSGRFPTPIRAASFRSRNTAPRIRMSTGRSRFRISWITLPERGWWRTPAYMVVGKLPCAARAAPKRYLRDLSRMASFAHSVWRPLLGRTFTHEGCSAAGPKTLILGEELWTRR